MEVPLQQRIAQYGTLGICTDHRLSGENNEDLCAMWHRLLKDRAFNIELATLNLIAAAAEMNEHTDFARYTEEEIKRTFDGERKILRDINFRCPCFAEGSGAADL